MTSNIDQDRHGQPIGFALPAWKPALAPERTSMSGVWCRLDPIDPICHGRELFDAFSQDTKNQIWNYLPYGPFREFSDFVSWIKLFCLSPDPLFHAIVDLTNNRSVGIASYLRVRPNVGVIEVGHINFSPALQHTRAGTEAMYLMMRRAFEELGYRRYEWKCDALNARSRQTAIRLGMTFEGVFRQATIYKKRNRDTAWYSILDTEWPCMKIAFETWLQPENFSKSGHQLNRLRDLVPTNDSS